MINSRVKLDLEDDLNNFALNICNCVEIYCKTGMSFCKSLYSISCTYVKLSPRCFFSIAPSNTCMHAIGFILLLHSKDDVGGQNRVNKILNKRNGNANSSIFILFSAICHKNVKESLANKTAHRNAWEK